MHRGVCACLPACLACLPACLLLGAVEQIMPIFYSGCVGMEKSMVDCVQDSKPEYVLAPDD